MRASRSWVLCKLSHRHPLPSWATSLLSPYKSPPTSTTTPSNSSSSKYVLHWPDAASLISICGRQSLLHLGSSLHASLIKHSHSFSLQNQREANQVVVLWNSLLSMYAKCGSLRDAATLFDKMPVRDVVSWNTMISSLVRYRGLEDGIRLFKQMQEVGRHGFDQATITTILSGCDGCEDGRVVTEMVHVLVVSSGYGQGIPVGNALITSYFKCEKSSLGMNVFEEMVDRNEVTWTAVISGLAGNLLFEDSLNVFVDMRRGLVRPNAATYLALLSACCGLQGIVEGRQVHGLVLKEGLHLDVCLESSLMDMYSKCGAMEDALNIFESAGAIDGISVTVILVGLAQNGYEEKAVRMFVQMVRAATELDPTMISAVLGVFSSDTSLAFGRQIHSLIIKRCFDSNIFVSNGLINMYSKCGNLEEANQVFSQMNARNEVSWNSMIAAYARHGNVTGAFEVYDHMQSNGVMPTDVTFVSLLHVCSHVGLVEKGMQFLHSMSMVYGLRPRMEHYACVVDMLGRAHLLKEAKDFIDGLPENPGVLVWQALLGACSFHGDHKLGKYAADQLNLAAHDTPESCVLMANIYSSGGKWKERAGEIRKLKEMGVTKETGISWIEIDKDVHSFVVADKTHPQSDSIYDAIAELFGLMVDEGYIPDKRYILSCLKQDEEVIPASKSQAL